MDPDTAFEQLFRSLAQTGPPEPHVAEVLGMILRVCRDHGAVLRQAEASEELGAVRASVGKATTAILRNSSARLTHAVCVALADACLGAVDGVGDRVGALATAARQLALVVDLTLGKHVLDFFRAQGRPIVVAPGDLVPFPASFPWLKRIHGAALGTSPERRGEHPGGVPKSGTLVPLDARATLELRFDADILDGLDARSQVACAIPSCASEVACPDPYETQEGTRFFGVVPKDLPLQRARVLALLMAADAEGAHVLVLPELSVDRHIAEAAAQWVESQARSLKLVVCGSFHERTNAGRSNTALVVVRGRPPYEHHKFARFDLNGAIEDITVRDPRIVVHYGAELSMATVICKDVLDAHAEDLLRLARVGLLLVPAFSRRTTDFWATAGSLASKAQTHVFVANLCEPDETERPAVAIVARPRRGQAADLVEELPRRGMAPPQLAVFDLGRPNSGRFI